MPNRQLKDSICTSETLNQLSDFEENLFYRLIVSCDDFGRFDARPAIIKARCYPLRERLTHTSINDALSSLARVGCVEIYSVENKPYLRIPAWGVHNTPRAKKSKFPSPERIRTDSNTQSVHPQAYENNFRETENIVDHLLAYENNCMQMQADAPDYEYEVEKNNAHECEIFFERAWKEYPKKKGKGQISASQKKKLFKLGDELMRAIARYRDTIVEKGTQEQFIMYGSTFFNSGHVDYLDANYASASAPSSAAPVREGFTDLGYQDIDALYRASLEGGDA